MYAKMVKAIPLILLFCSVACSVSAAEPAASPYSSIIFSDDFSGPGFDQRWGHYKSGSIVKDGVLVGITPENPDPAAVEAAFVFGRLSQTLERTQKTIRPRSERLLG